LDFELAGYPYYWFPATKKGYSGVAILSKKKPNNIVLEQELRYGFRRKDNLGDFDELSVMSLYLPSGTNSARLG
jgi:exodeoxyribonuclease-3